MYFLSACLYPKILQFSFFLQCNVLVEGSIILKVLRNPVVKFRA